MTNSNRTTLVLGASNNRERYSYLAVLSLLQAGIPVLALGGRASTVEGITIHLQWEELPADPIDTITLYVGADRQRPYYERILAARPRRIIFNPGTENPELMNLAQAAGIETMEACTLVMLRARLY